MDRIERIRAAKAAMDAEAMAEAEKKNKNITKFTNAIKALSGRLNELMVVGDEMFKNRISFGGTFYTCGMPYGEKFESNGITHELGFIFEYYRGKRVKLIGIGIEGGGCCGNDIVINREGEIITNPLDRVFGGWTEENAYDDFCSKAAKVIYGFDAFEKKFYDYVDSL